jgi:hypothetical protein
MSQLYVPFLVPVVRVPGINRYHNGIDNSIAYTYTEGTILVWMCTYTWSTMVRTRVLHVRTYTCTHTCTVRTYVRPYVPRYVRGTLASQSEYQGRTRSSAFVGALEIAANGRPNDHARQAGGA